MAHPGVELVRAVMGDRGEMTLEERRASLDAAAVMVPVPEGVEVTPTVLGGRPAERFTPSDELRRGDGVILYLHGGGYISGSMDSHRALAARIAAAAGRDAVSLDYRLAPEDPFPAAVDDAVAAYLALLEAGHDPSAIAVAGDSAGGGLALALLLALRDGGDPLPATAVLLSPWADLTMSAASYGRWEGEDPMLDRATLRLMADHYLAGADPTGPLASPGLADLAGLPPLMVQVGEVEVLLDDSVALAARAKAAGVSVELRVWPELIHVFPAFPYEVVPEAEEAITAVGRFIDRRLR